MPLVTAAQLAEKQNKEQPQDRANDAIQQVNIIEIHAEHQYEMNLLKQKYELEKQNFIQQNEEFKSGIADHQ